MTFPLEVLDDVRWRGVPVPGERQRTLLAAIVETSPASADRLIEQIWPDGAPDNAAKALQVVAVRARKATDANVLERVGDGYRLALAPDDVDVLVLLDRADRAATAADADEWARARTLARQALAIPTGDGGDTETSLGRLRLSAAAASDRCRVIAGLGASRLGAHAEALDLLTDEDALREDRVAVAVLKSTAAQRGIPSALQRYARYRAVLADRWGTDPAPAVRRAHAELLAADRPVRTGIHQDTTELVGRATDIAALDRLVRTRRVVTILGPGGLGKTRLAHVVARAAEQPVVHLVELVGARTPEAFWPTLGAALGTAESTPRGRPMRADIDPRSRVLELLAGPPTLLILDNCEQIIDTVAEAVGVLAANLPELTVLSTSRAPLSISAEYCYLPAQLDIGSGVRLFTERARAARPNVPLDPAVVATLVERLDGLPLAIELAAARVRVLSPEQILARIDERFTLLRAGDRSVPDRHRTLQAVIDWSWNLLSRNDRTALARLSVFHDGFTLDAAADYLAAFSTDGPSPADPVAATDLIQRLIEQSLLTVVDDATMRFRMLETVREFGRDRLADADERDVAAAALRTWATHFSRMIRPLLSGPKQAAAVASVRAEHTNLITELLAALAAVGDGMAARQAVAEIAAGLFTFWDVDGDTQRMFDLLGTVVDTIIGPDPAAGVDLPAESADAAREVLSISLTFDVMLRDRPSERGRDSLRALGPGSDPHTSAFAIVVLAAIEADDFGSAAGTDHLEDLLTRLSRDPRRQVALVARRWWCHRAESRGDVATAIEIIDGSIALHDPALDGPAAGADLLRTRAAMLQQVGRFAEAAIDARRALTILEDLGARYAHEELLPVIAMAELAAGRTTDAEALMERVLGERPQGLRGSLWSIGARDSWRAEVSAASGDFAAARDLRRRVLYEIDNHMPIVTELIGPVKPWLVLSAGAIALAAAARVETGTDGDDLWLRLRRDLAAGIPRDDAVDYPVAGVAAFALGLWGATRRRCAPEHAATLVALADRMGYGRPSLIPDWSAGVALLDRHIPGALARARDEVDGVGTAELLHRLAEVLAALPRD